MTTHLDKGSQKRFFWNGDLFQPFQHLKDQKIPTNTDSSCVVTVFHTASTVHDLVSPSAQINSPLCHRPKPRYPYVGCDKMRSYRRLYNCLARNGRNMKKMVGLIGNIKTILNHWEFCRFATNIIASMVFVGSQCRIHLQPRCVLHHKLWLPIHSMRNLARRNQTRFH